ncbi:GNAT family N-acetyltransferase [Longimicrobium terrae]|uniref:RimJ/RimL family protein N-acetyltransferase n=1 Tax=Longimicrobium terrae TaxID=1639882 RepID=A0A841GPH4_9BACT|nr:GNAT family N-acetyltransferase [Longimicrobium terrae]MBB4634260.1 RimJ/RimL family protein N-acetyltransferase [Longimicrobium terrae]MBB6068850.1 RimJ/RimL family protein N-acetyltransferase [Longimicrobium terrae]NNC28030.1 GNAT family N-acetyltransferase [Longimicrobium terrae]
MNKPPPHSSPSSLTLREMVDDDLDAFFAQQLDPDANWMAAFTNRDPSDREAFIAHWDRIRLNPTVILRTIVAGEEVAGYVSSYEDEGQPEITYWLGRAYWGRGIATRALAAFLETASTKRPIRARVAQDNLGSLRVLQKCGFIITGEDAGFAKARGRETSEYILMLHPM